MTDIEGFLTIYGHSDNLLNNNSDCLHKKTPVEMRGPGPAFFLYETSLKKSSYVWYNEIRSNVSLSPKV